MVEGDSFSCNGSAGEYRIISSFICDSSGVVYLLEYNVCGKQYVWSIVTPFRARFNSYKSASRRFDTGNRLQKQSFIGTFLRQISFQIIDRVFGDSRQREEFWQFELYSFIAEGLNVRFLDS